jgi:hypothetical protein
MQLRPRTPVDYSEFTCSGGRLLNNIPSQETLDKDNSSTYIKPAKHKCMGEGCFAKIKFVTGQYIAGYPGLLRDESQLRAHKHSTRKGSSVRVLELQQDTIVQRGTPFVACAIDGSRNSHATYINCTLNTEVSLDLC